MLYNSDTDTNYCHCWVCCAPGAAQRVEQAEQLAHGAQQQMQNFVSWFSFLSLTTVLISMLTSLVCAGVSLPGAWYCCRAPAAQSRRGHDSHKTVQPRLRMRICCHDCSPSAAAARGQQPGNWPCSTPGAAQRVEQAQRLARGAQQQMQLPM